MSQLPAICTMWEVIKTLKTQDHIPAKQYRALLQQKVGREGGKKKDPWDTKYFDNFTTENVLIGY